MKNFNSKERIIIFLIIFICGIILSVGLALLPSLFSDISINEMGEANTLDKMPPSVLRLQLFLNHLGLFLLPSLFYGLYIFGRSNFLKGFDLDLSPKIHQIIFAILLLIFCYPLVNLFHYINTLIPLSDWMIGAEQNVKELLNAILSSDNKFMLILNILLISVMPAIGEEFIFRGILQKNFSSLFKSGHFGVWLAAFLFSAIHMQFEGFLPRMMLGAVLGYSYFFTKNLWIPIILHFLNNLIPILAFMLLETDLTDTEVLKNNYSWTPLLISILGVPALIYFYIKYNGKPKNIYA